MKLCESNISSICGESLIGAVVLNFSTVVYIDNAINLVIFCVT